MERDDLYVDESYARSAVHDEDAGKAIRKKVYFVTALLSIITMVEVGMGIMAAGWEGVKWEVIKWSFIILTLIKAGYIVLVFMHLGDEKKAFKWIILIPYILFVSYLIFIALNESMYHESLFGTESWAY
jgi:cytochrome c oxidase subunit 4